MLDNCIVDAIKKFIQIKFEKEKLKVEFPNVLLRKDVLKLLDKYCTVIYYPLENESNNGFHINIPSKRSENDIQFVFINTAQTIEKQVFTAAHELGHIWKVDEFVASICPEHYSSEMCEDVISRFAAELLMPENEFRDAAKLESRKHLEKTNYIPTEEMLKVIAVLMDMFYTPSTAVIMRLSEVGILAPSSCDFLLGKGNIKRETLKKKLLETLDTLGYKHFLSPTPIKWIKDLPKLLDAAEEEGVVPHDKIENIRNKFDISSEYEADSVDGDIAIENV